MAEQDIVAAARALKAAHIRADALGGEHQDAVSQAYANLLAAVGEVDEPEEVAAHRAEVEALRTPPSGSVTSVEVNASQTQAASGG